jgi:hypothetical protein
MMFHAVSLGSQSKQGAQQPLSISRLMGVRIL